MIEYEIKVQVIDIEAFRRQFDWHDVQSQTHEHAAVYIMHPMLSMQQDHISIRMRRENETVKATIKRHMNDSNIFERYEWLIKEWIVDQVNTDKYHLFEGWFNEWQQLIQNRDTKSLLGVTDKNEQDAFDETMMILRMLDPSGWYVLGGTKIKRQEAMIIVDEYPWSVTHDQGLIYANELTHPVNEWEAELACNEVPDEIKQLRHPFTGVLASGAAALLTESKHEQIERLASVK